MKGERCLLGELAVPSCSNLMSAIHYRKQHRKLKTSDRRRKELATNHISSNHAEAGNRAGEQTSDTNLTTQLSRVKYVLRDPLTFVLLVWAVMFAVAGAFWILSQ